MKKVSNKQAKRNRELKKIKDTRERKCLISGLFATDLAHILCKGRFPEHYTKEWNLVMMERNNHMKYDNNLEFRQEQIKLFEQAWENDPKAATQYFRLYKCEACGEVHKEIERYVNCCVEKNEGC